MNLPIFGKFVMKFCKFMLEILDLQTKFSKILQNVNASDFWSVLGLRLALFP